MKTSELKKGQTYYYTAGAEYVKVVYNGNTSQGYSFTAQKVTNYLDSRSINLYIDRI
ncbi:MAG: hypothetical protein LBQ74_03750 [Prevotella sp.]|jgi:hypothetical protein|nr:hypothetical protein [Prevotella sp.]